MTTLSDPAALVRQQGYLYLPGVLDRSVVSSLNDAITTVLSGLGWLPGQTSVESAAAKLGRQEGSEGWWAGYSQIQRLEEFHRLPFQPPLVRLRDQLVRRSFVHGRKVANLLYPNFAVPPHQDYPAVQGDVDTFTLWVPLSEVDDSAGALRVLPESGARRMWALRALPDAGAEISEPLPDRGDWVSFGYRPGDVVVLHSLTVHELTVNRSGRLALSCDYRIQSRRTPACPASLEPHHYPRVPGFRQLSTGWTSRRWVRRPLGVPRARFLMPASIETWHTSLRVPSSRFVPVSG
jgi:hypothetical protein